MRAKKTKRLYLRSHFLFTYIHRWFLLISLSQPSQLSICRPRPPPHHLSYHIFTSNEASSKTRHFTSLYSLELVSLSPPNEPTPKKYIYIYMYICGREKWQSEEPNICVGRAHRGGARTIEMSSVPKATTMPFCPARHQSAWANNVAWLNTMNVIMSPPRGCGECKGAQAPRKFTGSQIRRNKVCTYIRQL